MLCTQFITNNCNETQTPESATTLALIPVLHVLTENRYKKILD